MKRLPFRLVAGGLIAAILGLLVVAAGLAFAILDEEARARSTDIPWPTVTAGQRTIVTLSASPIPTSTEIPVLPLPYPSVIPTLSPDQQTLPYPHPEVGPNPPPCIDCHQSIHGDGG